MILTDSILGNYNGELFQLIIVDIKKKEKEIAILNDKDHKCDRDHLLQ